MRIISKIHLPSRNSKVTRGALIPRRRVSRYARAVLDHVTRRTRTSPRMTEMRVARDTELGEHSIVTRMTRNWRTPKKPYLCIAMNNVPEWRRTPIARQIFRMQWQRILPHHSAVWLTWWCDTMSEGQPVREMQQRKRYSRDSLRMAPSLIWRPPQRWLSCRPIEHIFAARKSLTLIWVNAVDTICCVENDAHMQNTSIVSAEGRLTGTAWPCNCTMLASKYIRLKMHTLLLHDRKVSLCHQQWIVCNLRTTRFQMGIKLRKASRTVL